MRLYLSSFRVGEHSGRLLKLVGDNRRTAVVSNALDALPPEHYEQTRPPSRSSGSSPAKASSHSCTALAVTIPVHAA